ncbi:MAG: hypothetical protein IPL49_05620 [Saprospirales bacterium]|nr:hypothetical protein [Saprospirales bacterium]
MSNPIKFLAPLAFFAFAIGCNQGSKTPDPQTPIQVEGVRVRTAQVEPEVLDIPCELLTGDSSCVVVNSNGRSSYSICVEMFNPNGDTMTLEKLQLIVHGSNGDSVKDTCPDTIKSTRIPPNGSTVVTVPYCMQKDFTFQTGDSIVCYMDTKRGIKSESTLHVCTIKPPVVEQ